MADTAPKSFKRGTFRIQFRLDGVNGSEDWDCFLVGSFAVHRPHTSDSDWDGEKWRVSHAATGFGFPRVSFKSLKAAGAFIEKITPVIDWEKIRPGRKPDSVIGITPDMRTKVNRAISEAVS